MKKSLLMIAGSVMLACSGSVWGETITLSELPATVSASNAILLNVGDSVRLPAPGGANVYTNLAAHRFLDMQGTVVTAREPGFGTVQYRDPDNAVLSTVMFLIKPSMQEGGRVFVFDFAPKTGWDSAGSWIQEGVAERTAIPDDPKDVVFVPITSAKDLQFKVSGEKDVQDIYFGSPFDASTNFRFAGDAATGCRLNIHGIPSGPNARPGTFMVAGSGSAKGNRMECFYLGGSGSGTSVTLGCAGDVLYDFGGRSSNPNFENSNSNIVRSENGYGYIDIPEGRKFSAVNGHTMSGQFSDGQPWNERCWSFTRANAVTGKGVFEIAASGEFYLADNAFSAFEGEIVDSHRNAVSKISTDRSGPCWSSLHDMPNASMTIAGFVATNLEIKSSVGVFAQGNNGWGASAFQGNGLPYKGLTMDGGYVRMHKYQAKSGTLINSGTDYESYSQVANLNLRSGLNYFYLGDSPSTNEVIRRFTAESLRHDGNASLYIYDSRTYNKDTTRRSIVELNGISNFYVGNTDKAGEDVSQDVFPVVPWFLTKVENNNTNPWWGYVDADNRMARGGVRTAVKLSSVTDSRRNVYTGQNSITLTADVTVNALSVRDDGKTQTLGEGRTLTITSGGLILSTSGTAIGTQSGGAANGTVSFPNKAYIHATSTSLTAPNQIWAKILAPQGVVLGFVGNLVLGGDQSGIQGGITVNNGGLYLGSLDGADGCTIATPIELIGGSARLVVNKTGILENVPLSLVSAGGYGPKVALPAGATESCQSLTVDGQALPAGTYGATGSGAATIDDEHFAGTGVLTVLGGGVPSSSGAVIIVE